MTDSETARRFEAMAAPHLDAAYNLARWLARDPHDAQDVVQEAYLRAYRYFPSFRGGEARAWLLAIVRNTFYSWVQANRRGGATVEYDEAQAGLSGMEAQQDETLHGSDPAALWLRAAERQLVESALLRLPAESREILVLRELEELSYKEIAGILGVAMGTVMSRLSRARIRLRAEIEAMEGTP